MGGKIAQLAGRVHRMAVLAGYACNVARQSSFFAKCLSAAECLRVCLQALAAFVQSACGSTAWAGQAAVHPTGQMRLKCSILYKNRGVDSTIIQMVTKL